jgi:hypothetical protein
LFGLKGLFGKTASREEHNLESKKGQDAASTNKQDTDATNGLAVYSRKEMKISLSTAKTAPQSTRSRAPSDTL